MHKEGKILCTRRLKCIYEINLTYSPSVVHQHLLLQILILSQRGAHLLITPHSVVQSVRKKLKNNTAHTNIVTLNSATAVIHTLHTAIPNSNWKALGDSPIPSSQLAENEASCYELGLGIVLYHLLPRQCHCRRYEQHSLLTSAVCCLGNGCTHIPTTQISQYSCFVVWICHPRNWWLMI